MIFAYVLLIAFYLIWCKIGSTGLVFDFGHRSVVDVATVGRSMFAKYFTAAMFLVLIVVEIGVFVFSVYTVRNRPKFGHSHKLWKYFGIPFPVFFVLVIGSFVILGSYCNVVIDPVNAIGRQIFEVVMGAELLYFLDKALTTSIVLAFVAVTAIVTAASSLDPKVIHEVAGGRADEGQIQLARAEIAYQITWMKYYILTASLLLVTGVYFLMTWTALPLAYFTADESQKAHAFREAGNAIVVFEATFYVLVIAVVFVPIALRLLRAGAQMAAIEVPSVSEAERRVWMVKNGLTLSVGDSIQSVIAMLAPLLVPLLHQAAGLLPGR